MPMPANKDASITFSHLEYGELIKIETNNLGYDYSNEQNNSNVTYGITREFISPMMIISRICKGKLWKSRCLSCRYTSLF